MGTPPTDYTLIKLDKIEDLIREVKQLLQNEKPAPPVTVSSLVASRLGHWVFSLRPLAAGTVMMIRHMIAVGTIYYLAKNGQSEQAEPYIRWLLGV